MLFESWILSKSVRRTLFCDRKANDQNQIILPKLNSNPIRRRLVRVSSRIAETSRQMPSNAILQNVICEPYAHAGGGYGDVRKASYDGKAVAVKSFRIHMDKSSVWTTLKPKQAICREALIWKHLDHPYVLPFLGVYCIYPAHGFKSIVSPWCESGNMSNYLSTGNVFSNIEKSLTQLASGICYLHGENVVHGDLTGSNILLTEEYDLQISDFGLVKWNETSLVTGGSQGKGTARYMAPELFGSRDSESARPSFASDVFAFACLALEMTTGKVPFYEYLDVVVPSKVMAKKRPPRPDCQGIPDYLWNLIDGCWSHEPTARPSMEKVLAMMEEWSRRLGSFFPPYTLLTDSAEKV
ncbi:kinase-like domain-containing protein [Mycena leptocephala]|nr:kinase-like domain-containing protein [Mycena leptocephala]